MQQQRPTNLRAREDMKIVLARLAAFLCLAILLVISVLKVETTEDQKYEDFIREYGKRYQSDEQSYRMLLKIKKEMANNKHNSDLNSQYQRDLNQFSDLSSEEFEQLYLNLNQVRMENKISIDYVVNEPASQFNISWVQHLPPIKDRGRCHADYAFAAVSAVEALVNMRDNRTQNHTAFSEQQIIDCCEKCSGCQTEKSNTTTDIRSALQYVLDSGLDLQSTYQYKNAKGQCKGSQKQGQKISDFMQIKTFTGVLNALKKGPLIVTLDARNWQDYNGGVMSNCGRKMNHLALLVGRTPEHFIIRNSWGRRWGERGYIRIVIGYTCGIINEAYVAEL